MAVCSRCGSTLNPNERFCGNCGLDTQATAQQATTQQAVPQQTTVRQTVPQQAAVEQTTVRQNAPQAVYTPQAVYAPPVTRATNNSAPGRVGDNIARAAMGLGIGGGLLGILWGALGPYLSLELPAYIGWFSSGVNPYLTGIEPIILLVVGLALGVLAVLGASVATKAIVVTRVLLLVCGLGGFILGPSWQLPGALLLVGAGLAIAARPNEK